MTPTPQITLTPALNEPSLEQRTLIIKRFLKAKFDNKEPTYPNLSGKDCDDIRKLYDKYFKPSHGEQKFKSTELDNITVRSDKICATNLCFGFRVQGKLHLLAPHRLAGGEPNAMERIMQILDDDQLWRNIPGYYKIYKINREGIIYDVVFEKFLIPSAYETTVELEIEGQMEQRIISRLVRQAFAEPDSSDDAE